MARSYSAKQRRLRRFRTCLAARGFPFHVGAVMVYCNLFSRSLSASLFGCAARPRPRSVCFTQRRRRALVFPRRGAATPRRGTMGSVLSSEPQAPEERSALQKEINKVMLWLRLGLGLLTISATLYPNQVIAENPVVIFSKTWCLPCVHGRNLMHSCSVACHVQTCTGQVRLLRASKAALRPLGRESKNS